MLRGLTLRVASGRCLQVLGPNGAGKTTLVRTLAGLVQPDSMELQLRGKPISPTHPDYLDALAYLGHEAPLKAELTVRENIAYAVGIRRPVGAQQLDAAMQRTGVGALADRATRALSAGQRRRVALAALWLAGASIWLLDEPVTNLDEQGQILVANLIDQHLAGGGIVIAATHQRLGVAADRLDSLALESTP